MANIKNKVNLIGRVTKAPQTQQTNGGQSFVQFNLAVNRLQKNDDGSYQSDIIPCELWGKLVPNFVKYVAKGSLIAIEAELRADHYTTKDGNNALRLRILIDSWENLESRQVTMNRQNKGQGNYSNSQSNNLGNNNFQSQNNQSQGNYQQGSWSQNQGNFNNRPNSVPGENLDNPPQW